MSRLMSLESSRIDDWYTSPPSSEQSSGDEKPQVLTHERRMFEKVDGERFPIETRDCMTKHSRSVAQDSRSGSGTKEQTTRRDESHEIFATTMDTKAQQRFIALFYWRNKVLRTHFSAWKWVVFTLHPFAKQASCQRRKLRSVRPLSVDYTQLKLHRPRRNLILKRHTRRSSVERHGSNSNVRGSPISMELNPINAQSSKRDTLSLPLDTSSSKVSDSTKKRRQFRAELHLVYSCLRLWKLQLEVAKERRARQFVQAMDVYRVKQLAWFLRAWKTACKSRQLKRKQADDANQFHRVWTKRHAFCSWQRYYRVEREITWRRRMRIARQSQFAFQHWYRCTLQTRKCRFFAEKHRHDRLRCVLRIFRQHVTCAAQERLKYHAAIVHEEKKVKLLGLCRWRKAVFEDASYLQTFNHSARISLASGIRKWQRFIVERHLRAHKVLSADFFRYRVSMRRAVQGWSRFLEWRRQRNRLYDSVQRHYERNKTMSSLHRLRLAVQMSRNHRGQVRTVTKWHERRLVVRIFELWVHNTRKQAQLHAFRQIVQAKVIDHLFRAWIERTAAVKKLRLKRNDVAACYNGLVRARYMTRWQRAFHVNSFISCLESKRRQRSMAKLYRAWKHWSTTRILWRNIVHEQRRQKHRVVLHCVIGEWCQVLLRKRCCKRIVKLLQKKHSRNRVKCIFRLWQVYVRLCSARRQRHLDRIHLALVRWRQICQDCKETRRRRAIAIQYYSERRYALAVTRWTSFANRSVQRRRTASQALSHYFRQVLKSSLQHWYIVANRLQRQADFIRDRRRLREQKTMTNCLHAWYQVVRQRIQCQARQWIAHSFHSNKLLDRSLFAWVSFLKIRRASNEQLCLAMVSFEKSLQWKVLKAWHRAASQAIQLRQKCSLLQSTLQLRRLQSTIVRWSNFDLDRQHYRTQIALAKTFYNQYLACLAMSRWQVEWSKASMIQHKQAQIRTNHNVHRLSSAISQWYTQCQNSSNIRAKKTKAQRFYTNKVLGKHFDGWKRTQQSARSNGSKLKFATHFHEQNLTSQMVQTWRRFLTMHTFERLQNTKALRHRSMRVLGLAFRCWKSYRSQRTLCFLGSRYYRKLLLQKCWLGWTQYHKHVAKVRQNVLATAQVLRHNVFQATFVRWKMYASCCQEWRYQLYVAKEHHIHWQVKRVVSRFKTHAQCQQIVKKAAMLGHVNQTRYVWRSWQVFVAGKHERQSWRTRAEQSHRQRHQRKHLLAWKLLTKSCVQRRRDKSDALYRAWLLKTVWGRWFCVVGWHRRIAAMECWRLEHLQINVLRTWRACIEAKLKQEAKMAKALMFQKNQLQAKVWRSWLWYIENGHEKHKQLVRVLRHYSVQVLLRRALVSWKGMVTEKQTQRAQTELALSFNVNRLICRSFLQWKAYLELRRTKRKQMEAQLRKAELIALSRNLGKWRSRAIVRRQQRHSEARALQLHRRKQVRASFTSFRRWKTSQAIARSLSTKAKRFRDQKAAAMCFKAWQRRYHWCRRNDRVTRVFKHKRKELVFLRWKLYWKMRRSSHEKQLTARVFHCVHVEQSTLVAWRTFICQQKQVKTARALIRAKRLRAAFTFWQRRAHVERQMRRMLRCQELLRVQSHFAAWKRVAIVGRALNEKLRRVTKLHAKICKSRVWQHWHTWLNLQRQQQAALELAMEFHKHFVERKCVAEWQARADCWKRQRLVRDRASIWYRTFLLRQGLQVLATWRQSQLQLATLGEALSAQCNERRKRRGISTLRALCAVKHHKNNVTKYALQHWQLAHQQKYWQRLVRWLHSAKTRTRQQIRAIAFARSHLLRRYLCALERHVGVRKLAQAKVDACTNRHLWRVVDVCFAQWKTFTTFRQRLRVLRRRRSQSQCRQRLEQWHCIAREQLRRRTGMQQLALKRRQRELASCFNHWESVCTDRWIANEVVAYHERCGRRHGRLRSAIKVWKAQLVVRQERHKWQSFFRHHHCAFLLSQVLKQWRHAIHSST